MIRAVLTRRDRGDHGVFGQVRVRGWWAYSGELPDRGNRPNISCIPDPGLYGLVWTWSPRFRRFMYELTGVRGRFAIRAHSANLMGDRALGYRAQLNGCIAFGEKLGWMDGQKALLLSAPAVRRFEDIMGRKTGELLIR